MLVLPACVQYFSSWVWIKYVAVNELLVKVSTIAWIFCDNSLKCFIVEGKVQLSYEVLTETPLLKYIQYRVNTSVFLSTP